MNIFGRGKKKGEKEPEKTLPKTKSKLEEYDEKMIRENNRQEDIRKLMPMARKIVSENMDVVYDTEIVRDKIYIKIKSGKACPPIFCLVEQSGLKAILSANSSGMNYYPSGYDNSIILSVK